jgi:hypothetical protein
MAPQQLPLDLAYRPALGMADFVIAPGNRDAVAWIDRWPDWPSHALAIHGPKGSGKSHLAHVWQARSGAVFLDRAPDDEAPQQWCSTSRKAGRRMRCCISTTACARPAGTC